MLLDLLAPAEDVAAAVVSTGPGIPWEAIQRALIEEERAIEDDDEAFLLLMR
jgi:hypothetical protein